MKKKKRSAAAGIFVFIIVANLIFLTGFIFLRMSGNADAATADTPDYGYYVKRTERPEPPERTERPDTMTAPVSGGNDRTPREPFFDIRQLFAEFGTEFFQVRQHVE